MNTVISSIDKIRDTASSHHRVFFVEVMGKDAGSLAIDSALGSAIETVLIPEEQTDIMKLVDQIKLNVVNKKATIVIVAEGDDAGNSSIIIEKVRPYLEGVDLKQTILGHVQRGGSPSAFDRLLGTSMGNIAVNKLIAGCTNKMISIKNNKICLCDLNNIGKSSQDINQKLRIIQELADLSI